MSAFPAYVRREVDEDGYVPPMRSQSLVVEAIDAFFAEHEIASLRLPSGWFGRPHDNMHRLSKVATEDGYVRVTLDERQVLTLDAVRASLDGRILSIEVRSGSWAWVEYGSHAEHAESVGSGTVELHAFGSG